MENQITMDLKVRGSDAEIVLGTAYARHTETGVAINVDCQRIGGGKPGAVVRWNVNSGGGWQRGYKRTCATVDEAAAFAAQKLATMLAWLETATPTAPAGLPGDWTSAS